MYLTQKTEKLEMNCADTIDRFCFYHFVRICYSATHTQGSSQPIESAGLERYLHNAVAMIECQIQVNVLIKMYILKEALS